MGKRRRRRDGPAAPPERPALARWDEALRETADRRFGPVDEARLARSVAEVSRVYNFRRDELPAAGPRGARAEEARLRFFVPRDLRKVLAVLDDLAAMGALPPTDEPWRILDLGAGLGTATFAACVVAEEAGARVEALGVDRDRSALGLFAQAVEVARRRGLGPQRLRTEVRDVGRHPPPAADGPWDLVLASLTLNELLEDADPPEEAGADLLEAWARDLGPGGTLVVVEPALRPATRRLQGVRDAVVGRDGALRVFAPCPHDAPCPMLLAGDRDWCHRELVAPLPGALQGVARGAGLRGRKLTSATLVLRRDDLREAPTPYLRVVSAPRVQKGRTEVTVCGAAGLRRLVRQHRDDRESDDPPLDALVRGDVIALAGSEGGAAAEPPAGARPLPPDWSVRRARPGRGQR